MQLKRGWKEHRFSFTMIKMEYGFLIGGDILKLEGDFQMLEASLFFVAVEMG